MPKRVVFYLNPNKDHDLIKWLQKQDNGARSAAIRNVLRSGLDSSQPSQSSQQDDIVLGLAAIREAVEVIKNSRGEGRSPC